MRVILVSLFTIAAAGLFGVSGTSAATPSAGAIRKAAAKASLVTRAKCRYARRCTYWGCSEEAICN
jgi:hypothetical protein